MKQHQTNFVENSSGVHLSELERSGPINQKTAIAPAQNETDNNTSMAAADATVAHANSRA